MIRKATIWDCTEIASMWVAMEDEMSIRGRRTDGKQKEQFYVSLVTKLYLPNWVILVSEEDDKLTGFIMGFARYYEYGVADYAGKCDHVYVRPNYRGKKAFDGLIDGLLDCAKKLGVKFCEFETVYDEKLIRIWERKGFRPSQVVYNKEV